MTIATETNRVNYIGDGIITQFSFIFKTTDDSHLKVYLDDVLQSADYTITRNADQDVSPGGVVDFTAGAPAIDVKVTLHREVPNTQLVDYSPYDPFPSQTHENALDNLTMQVQQMSDELDRSAKAPVSDDGSTDYTLPPYEASKIMQWDATLKKLINAVYPAGDAPVYVESKTLSDGQVSVTFTNSVNPASFYIAGDLSDNGRLLEIVDYTVDVVTGILTLTQSYPSGTTLNMVYGSGAAISGASGTFTSADAKTITVVNGLITNIT